MNVRCATGAELAAAIARLADYWGEPILMRGASYFLADCEIFVAGEMDGLAAVSLRDAPIAELVAINAFAPHEGIGTALIDAIVAWLTGRARTLRLSTTNDNLDAIRFYQRRGFRLTALRPGAVVDARRLKPGIPLLGDHGIPIRDELDLIRDL